MKTKKVLLNFVSIVCLIACSSQEIQLIETKHKIIDFKTFKGEQKRLPNTPFKLSKSIVMPLSLDKDTNGILLFKDSSGAKSILVDTKIVIEDSVIKSIMNLGSKDINSFELLKNVLILSNTDDISEAQINLKNMMWIGSDKTCYFFEKEKISGVYFKISDYKYASRLFLKTGSYLFLFSGYSREEVYLILKSIDC